MRRRSIWLLPFILSILQIAGLAHASQTPNLSDFAEACITLLGILSFCLMFLSIAGLATAE